MGQWDGLGHSRSIAGTDNRISVAGFAGAPAYVAGVAVLDLSDPARPEELGFFALPLQSDIMAAGEGFLLDCTYTATHVLDLAECGD